MPAFLIASQGQRPTSRGRYSSSRRSPASKSQLGYVPFCERRPSHPALGSVVEVRGEGEVENSPLE